MASPVAGLRMVSLSASPATNLPSIRSFVSIWRSSSGQSILRQFDDPSLDWQTSPKIAWNHGDSGPRYRSWAQRAGCIPVLMDFHGRKARAAPRLAPRIPAAVELGPSQGVIPMESARALIETDH